ncbi:mRNA surveillance protein pelota [Candidatus Woesearchaeota archaeon]|nr:mRNA surveillance protein pelota [Candidatus Woesearchaeota archaeon]
MKITHKNLKQGEIKVLVETPEDLWYLSQIIDAGDTIKGKTPRKIKPTEEAEATKRMVYVAITTEKVEFTADTLRIGGKITEGPEDVPRGSYHTFAIEPKSTITIIKQHWYGYQLDRLEEATEAKQAKIIICVFDREEAYFALMKRTGAEVLSHIKGEVEKKRITTKITTSFYQQIIKQLEQYNERYKLDYIILASPSFWKEELLKELKNENLKKKIIQATCSSTDEQAINEVLKREEVSTALKQERTSKEIVLVEKVLSEIAKKGAVVYGMKATEEAANAGAIETLLITDTLIQKLRQENKFEQADKIMRTTDKQKGKVAIISGEHSGGKKLDGIGGIAALLRYKLSYD